MAKKRLRKTLPKELNDLLDAAAKTGDEGPVKEALERCLPDARGGYGKGNVLGFRTCSPSLARWAVARGADVNGTNTWGRTPLHEMVMTTWSALGVDDLVELGADAQALCNNGQSALHYAAGSPNLKAVERLLELGLDPNLRGRYGTSPLEWALQRLSNVDFPRMVPVAEALLAAGAERTEDAQKYATTAAENFEFHRAGFNPDSVDEVSAAVEALCGVMGVAPPKRRRMHDGTSPITSTAERWQDRHNELWDYLVPSSGPCATVQGEVVRITGRISDELFRNGGGNWDRAYRQMVNALIRHLGSAEAIPDDDLAEARRVGSKLLQDMNGNKRLAELAVRWVDRNPTPIPLDPPSYDR